MKNKKFKKLRNIFSGIASPEEVKEVDSAKASKDAINRRFDEVSAALKNVSTSDDVKQVAQQLESVVNKTRSDFVKLAETMNETYEDSMKQVSRGLAGISTSIIEQTKGASKNAAPVYKDIIRALADVKKSVDEKPVPSWNWPQYAGVSVRNKNFANINPAIQGFGIEDFDEVQLSNYSGANVGTVTYLLNGTVMAVLSLTYDGSDNLTDVVRTQ